MAILKRDELRRRLKANQIEPLYLLHGAEDYLRDRAARAIAEAAFASGDLRDFNLSTFDLSTTDAQHALAVAEQLPMMASRRVVRIENFVRLREADDEALARYVARPSTTTTMIFVADELDKRRRLSKTLLDVCAAVEFAPLGGAELLGWMQTTMRELRAEADDRTLTHLAGLVGASTRRLSIELKKLATAALPSNRIMMELVDELVGRSREMSNFELSDDLLAGQRERALQTLRHLLDDGAEPLMLLGLIGSHYHRLSLAKSLMAQGAPKEQVFGKVGIAYGKREEFLQTARRASVESLAQSIERIAAADIAIKTSLATPRLQIEMLVCELTSSDYSGLRK